MRNYHEELNQLREQSLLRQTRVYERSEMTVTTSKGENLIDFSSNDYLGLSQHPSLIETAHEANQRYGVGSTGSRLVSGSSPAHEAFEERLAHEKKAERALFFANGFMTSMATIPTLVGKEDVVILDKLSHACLIDAARASGARLRVFPHNNLHKLESLLKSERKRLAGQGRILIIVESVYSMDGDLCPLADLVRLKEQYGALLLVDEAHGLGVLGSSGMGLADDLNLSSQIDLQMGTLGKAAGGAGGYLATSHLIGDFITNKGRAFIYTTAPPPAQAAVALKALELIISPLGAELRERLGTYRTMLGNALNTTLPSAICPLILGDNTTTLDRSALLRSRGLLIPAIRYPTVAKGTARLRITLSARHSLAEIETLMREITTDA